MIWINVILALGIGMMFPVYRHMQQTHQLIENAKATGVWMQIPQYIPVLTDYVNALQKQAELLSLKLTVQENIVTVQAVEPLTIYTFLHCMIQMPALCIKSFSMKREKGRVSATIILGKSVARHRGSVNYIKTGITTPFYSPRFFYVNAVVEVDGKKQIWVNGENYGPTCPWPLYYTFDLQTGIVKKGDVRPRLSLTSGV